MPRKLIRDAVHGDIELESLEMEVVDTPEFQRLRGIRQLGTAYLVYPSALHSRFEHSLGTSWMAHRMVEAIRRRENINADEETLIRVTALLHDITHIPYGHTLEDERRILPRHDKDEARVRYFLEQGTIGRILGKAGIQKEVIAALRSGNSLCGDIASGPISADLLDYLRRDTYFCGLSQYYDARIFESFVTEHGRLVMNLEKRGVLRRDALSELVNLLRIRYTLSERVYFHHAKIASGAMICRAVELALQEGLRPQDLRVLKDETLLFELRSRYGKNTAIMHLLDCLDSRRLYKSCYTLNVEVGETRRRELVALYHEDARRRELTEQRIAGEANLPAHHVIVYCPSFKMSLPEADVPVRMEGGQLLPLSGSNNEEIRILKEKHKALWKFFVFVDRESAAVPEIFDTVVRAARAEFGTNE